MSRLCSKKNWREPSIWFVWKIWDFLVARGQKLGAKGHWALLQHSPECAYQQSKEILKYFEDLATCLPCAFLSAEFFDMNGTIFMKTHIFWSKLQFFFWLPLQLSCKTRLETLATQALTIGAAIFKTSVVWQFFFSQEWNIPLIHYSCNNALFTQ